MKSFVSNYFLEIKKLLTSIKATDEDGDNIDFLTGFAKAVELIKASASLGGKLIFIGNGASAAISSHQATDFWKNAKVKAVSFNDPSLLTCIANDFGYRQVFQKPIEMFAEPRDLLLAISSSGESKNILQGVKAALQKGAKVVTFSGFDKNNPLRKSGDINFYVPASSYGYVEIAHLSICHCLVDVIREELTE